MNARPIKIALLGAGVLAAVVLGGGAAYASTSSSTTAPPATTHATHQVTTASGTGQNPATGSDKADSTTEKGGESSTEAPTPNDGPGGHADADGVNVDHQFNGNE